MFWLLIDNRTSVNDYSSMELSQFQLLGISRENGFPVVQVQLHAEMVTGRGYTKFNRDLARALKQYQGDGMVNLILIADNPRMDLPSLSEIAKATKTPDGRFLEELLRQIILVGFDRMVIKAIATFATLTTGVKVVVVDSPEEAYELVQVAA